MSETIASNILRMFSACLASREWRFSLPSLVTPSTQRATSGPNFFWISSTVVPVSFHNVMKQPRFQGNEIDLHIGQDERDIQWMADIRLARIAHLNIVVFGRKEVCLAQRGQVFVGT